MGEIYSGNSIAMVNLRSSQICSYCKFAMAATLQSSRVNVAVARHPAFNARYSLACRSASPPDARLLAVPPHRQTLACSPFRLNARLACSPSRLTARRSLARHPAFNARYSLARRSASTTDAIPSATDARLIAVQPQRQTPACSPSRLQRQIFACSPFRLNDRRRCSPFRLSDRRRCPSFRLNARSSLARCSASTSYAFPRLLTQRQTLACLPFIDLGIPEDLLDGFEVASKAVSSKRAREWRFG